MKKCTLLFRRTGFHILGVKGLCGGGGGGGGGGLSRPR